MNMDDESVRIVKRVGAPVDRVYRAFIEPDQLVAWMHPDGFTGNSSTNDPREGGSGELKHNQPDGGIGGFNWTYLEVTENERLVMDWQFGPAGADPDGKRSVLTIELREEGPESTEVTLTHDRLGEAPPGGHMGVNTGWTQALESLGRHFGTEAGEE